MLFYVHAYLILLKETNARLAGSESIKCGNCANGFGSFKMRLSHLNIPRLLNGSRLRLFSGSTLRFLVGGRRLGGIHVELFIEVLGSQGLLRWQSLLWRTVLCRACSAVLPTFISAPPT